ncbi:enoyl-CoA hydratase [Sporosarcina aquimarina]|uniref:Enoyl-CoA hydratase n=1 Tax=Sporosarcina aquimarina TaxID=114975 RepID=A0ABU4G2E4_9BACL|nr:enoyl-CoA hydratase [Sporosarcina aquimarina]MDW0111056.1 enoyl-CoA hydratase [Sporosarcina aquimarina]
MFQTIELTKEDRLATLTFNRPESMNAMDDVMMEELADAFEELKADSGVQVVLIKGAGRTFSAGGDIKKMMDPESPMDMGAVMQHITRLSKALYLLPQITIASIHGACAGLGFSLALGCDIIVAEDDSKLAMNFIGIGLVPDGGGHFFLKERIGATNAKKMIWGGEVLDAKTAKAAGLIDELVPSGQAEASAKQLANALFASPISAMIATKKILHESNKAELEHILQLESEAQVAMRSTKDHQEGIRAFVEKRPPVFKGN